MTGKNPTPEKIEANAGRVVAVGGGTGLSSVLRGLKKDVAPPLYAAPPLRDGSRDGAEYPISDLAAIVTVTDDGGSSGRLRREYSILPPGDIRNCLVALADDELGLEPPISISISNRPRIGRTQFRKFISYGAQQCDRGFRGSRSSKRASPRNPRKNLSSNGSECGAGSVDVRRPRSERRDSNRQSARAYQTAELDPCRVKPLPDVMNAIENAGVILLGRAHFTPA